MPPNARGSLYVKLGNQWIMTDPALSLLMDTSILAPTELVGPSFGLMRTTPPSAIQPTGTRTVKACSLGSTQRWRCTTPPVAGGVVHLHRWVEPREQALTVLVPVGWIAEGGVVRINPKLGPTNSVGAKIDVSIKKDKAGSVMIHWFPNFTYKDPRAFGGMGNFPVGSNYMRSTVYPLQDPQSFLVQIALRQKRPQAQNVQITERKPLPE